MDSFELNKIIGAILGTLLFVMGVGFLAEGLYSPAHSSGPGYALPEPAEGGGGDTPAPGGPTAAVDIGTLLASADAKQGEASAKKCGACHDFSKGGPNKTGPNLWDIVEEKIAATPGYSFSPALMAHAADVWTYDNLNQWLTSPKAWAPGTKMTFAGVKDDKERANIIAYLASLSDSPKPFPQPAAAAGGAAPTAAQTTDGTSSAPAATETPASSSEAPAAAPASSSEAPAAAPASSVSEAPASSSEAPAMSSASSSAAQ